MADQTLDSDLQSSVDTSGSPDSGFGDVAWGVVWTVAAVWLWLQMAGDPIKDLKLTLNAETTSGRVIDTWEDVDTGDDGRANFVHSVTYVFRTANGVEVAGGSGSGGPLPDEFSDTEGEPVSVEVEYLESNPAVNRISGYGSNSFEDWLFRKVGLGGLLLGMFIWPGLAMMRSGIKTWLSRRPTNGSPSVSA